IRCTARIHEIYLQSSEKSIEEERPRVISQASSSSSSSSNSINMIQNSPYDQLLDDELDRKDFMTHLHGMYTVSTVYGKKGGGTLVMTTPDRSQPQIRPNHPESSQLIIGDGLGCRAGGRVS
ncbi:hypothetical protein pipiens_009101, partial [Culex pipiens pipiens]